MSSMPAQGYENLSVYFGDLHNHCDLSYGHGSLDAALENARLQMDFASVTVHAVWPDLPTDDAHLGYLVDYHAKGFAKAAAAWPGYLVEIDAANQDGHFVTYPSFEWHSMHYGDHCVYYRDGQGGPASRPIVQAENLPALRQAVRSLATPAWIIPHHIGYRQGYRGINWDAFSDECSPVTEVFSFHGQSISSEGPFPYLHSMGPRHQQSTAAYGWELGHVFGVVGSTDHHNAFPGSYGYGRLGVWASALSRDAIWEAITARRTYALTGDRIEVAFALNGQPMGAVTPTDTERWIDVAVHGGDAIDYVDVYHNNRVVHRENCFTQPTDAGHFTIYLEVGWGERSAETQWDVTIAISGGKLVDVEPRFRGYGPTAAPPDDADYAYTTWHREAEDRVGFRTKTRQNLSLHTPATEGMALTVAGDAATQLHLTVNGVEMCVALADLFAGAQTFYRGGFVSPALCLHQAVPLAETRHRFGLLHRSGSSQRDWYTIHVRQRNNQWAWTSPIWVNGEGPARQM